jgi:hypothetical protein
VINLLYVGLAVVVSVVGYFILNLKNRRPGSVQHGVDEFSRELRALAPGSGRRRSRWRGGRAG